MNEGIVMAFIAKKIVFTTWVLFDIKEVGKLLCNLYIFHMLCERNHIKKQRKVMICICKSEHLVV